MTEVWKDIAGYEGRYQVSNMGRVRSIPFLQRYLLRNGVEAYRLKKEKILATQAINSGYRIAHLHLFGTRKAFLVHRLVALAFLPQPGKPTVNHRNGDKTDNRVDNLEWATHLENVEHAVENGLNTQAIRVADPTTGAEYASISKAAKHARKAARVVSAQFIRVTGVACSR